MPELKPRRSKRPRTRGRDDVNSLKQRAKLAGAGASKVPIATTIRLDLFRALVELAEEYEQNMTDVLRDVIEAGIRKYRDFRPRGNAFQKPLPVPSTNLSDYYALAGKKTAAPTMDVREQEMLRLMENTDIPIEAMVPGTAPLLPLPDQELPEEDSTEA